MFDKETELASNLVDDSRGLDEWGAAFVECDHAGLLRHRQKLVIAPYHSVARHGLA